MTADGVVLDPERRYFSPEIETMTRPEIDALDRQGFAKADTNHDGVLDAAEIAKARARR